MESASDCRVCGASDPDSFRIWFDGHLKLFRCRRCGYVGLYASPGLATPEMDYEQAYSLNYLRRGPFEFPEREPVLRDIVERTRREASQGRLLDVGCGDGHFLALCKDVWRCEGIDPCVPLAEQAARASGVPVKAGYYDAEAYPAESFDVISFVQVLEHLSHPLEALQAAHSHLTAAGVLVVEVPSVCAPDMIAYRLSRVKWFVAPPRGVIKWHLSYFSPGSLTVLISRAGFHDVKLVTGRWAVKYSGWKQTVGRILDPAFERAHIGGILLFARKA
jgi:SAM-dependent methyltransferase